MNKSNVNIREIVTEVILKESATVSNLLNYIADTIVSTPTLKAFIPMKQNKIASAVVLQAGIYIGLVHIHDITRKGIV